MIGRRSALRALAALPFAGKAAAEKVAADLAGLKVMGGPSASSQAPPGSWVGGIATSSEATSAQLAQALRSPQAKAEIEEILFRREYRNIGAIDPDIAVMRSFSLSAKIAFQRQRNVARHLEGMMEEYSPWRALQNAVKKAVGIG